MLGSISVALSGPVPKEQLVSQPAYNNTESKNPLVRT